MNFPNSNPDTSGRNLFNYIRVNHDQNLVKDIRKLEGCTIKFTKCRLSRVFNLRCLHNQVYPVGCKLKYNSKNHIDRRIINNTQRNLVKNRISECNTILEKLTKEIETIKTKLNTQVND